LMASPSIKRRTMARLVGGGAVRVKPTNGHAIERRRRPRTP
jgi:hypothetical protein